MLTRKIHRASSFTPLLAGIMFALHLAPVQAKELSETTGLLDFITGGANTQPGESLGIKWGGWINSSVSTNFNSSPDNYNGPVTFNDRSGEFQLNQFNLWIQKAVTTSGDNWDFGGRFDFMFGTDAIFTQAYGVPYTDPRTGLPLDRGHWDLHLLSHDNRFYGIALPQAYAEFNLPIGNGLNVKAGHFYTPIGYEVVTAPDNFFFSKPYTFQYGEPFTHTGILGSYPIDDNWSVMAGAVTGSATGGWDGNWDRQLGNWSFLGGATWTSTDKAYSLALTSSAGNRSEQFDDAWAIYSLVGKANFLDNTLHYVIQHDHGFADNVITANSLKRGPGQLDDARWYGINQYLMYDVQDDLAVGIRAEWWRDNNGFRVAGPGRCGASTNLGPDGLPSSFACQGNYASYPFAGSNYYEITAGLNWKPTKWATVRPNLRYDWTDNIKVFDAGKRTTQLLFSTDVVITF